jgi:hypothetical protein
LWKPYPCYHCAKDVWVKQPDGTIVPGPVCTGKPCGECQRRKKGCLRLAAGAYSEIDRLRGLGACDAAVTACKAFGKLLEKKKSNQTAAKNTGNTAGDDQRHLLLLILNKLREQAHKEPLGLEETKDWGQF